MSQELGPFPAAYVIVWLNPDDAKQVRQVTGSGSPRFINQSSSTFALCGVVCTTRTGSPDYYGDIPAGMDASRVTLLKVFQAGATAYTDSQVFKNPSYEPEIRRTNNSDGDKTATSAAQTTLVESIAEIPTAVENADVLLNLEDGIEAGWTLKQVVRTMASVIFGRNQTDKNTFLSITGKVVRVIFGMSYWGKRKSVYKNPD